MALRDLVRAFDMEGGRSRRRAMAEALAFARTALLADALADDVVRQQREAELERGAKLSQQARVRALSHCQSCCLGDHARCVGETTLGTSLCMCDCNTERRRRADR